MSPLFFCQFCKTDLLREYLAPPLQFVQSHALGYPQPAFAISVKSYQHHATKITCTVVTIASSDCEINPNDINISLSGAPMGVSGCPRPYFGSFCTSKRNIPKRQFRKNKKFFKKTFTKLEKYGIMQQSHSLNRKNNIVAIYGLFMSFYTHICILAKMQIPNQVGINGFLFKLCDNNWDLRFSACQSRLARFFNWNLRKLLYFI